MIRILLILALASALGACQKVEFPIDRQLAAATPRATAVDQLTHMRDYSPRYVVIPGDAREQCQFSDRGLRVASADPNWVAAFVRDRQAELVRIAQVDKPAAVRALAQVEAAQKDEGAWYAAHGYGNLIAEQASLADDHRSAERWLRLRGFAPDQMERAKVEMEKEKKDFDKRLSDARYAKEQELKSARHLIDMLQDREADAPREMADVRAGQHDPVPYPLAIFSAERFLTTTTFTIAYGKGDCTFKIVGFESDINGTFRQIVNALVAVGAAPRAL